VRAISQLLNQFFHRRGHSARQFLETEMEKFFFAGGSAAPKDFVPPAE
jgi:Fe-S cluster biosynthesis and repair protein YggX